MRLKNNKEMVRNQFPFNVKKLGAGAVLVVIGLICAVIYFKNPSSWIAALGMIFGLLPGVGLILWAWKSRYTAVDFISKEKKRKRKGNENAILVLASPGNNGNKDQVMGVYFARINNVPKGARQHYVRNFGKHFYLLKNDTKAEAGKRHLVDVRMPDRKPFLPGMFTVPAVMQEFKEAVEYMPPTVMDKVKPALLLVAMLIVMILMIVTLG